MKILIIITKAELGGAQMFVLNLCRALKERGDEVIVASGAEGFLSEELKREGIDFHIFKNLKRGFNPFTNYLFAKELKKYVENNNFSVVHLNSTNTLLGVWSLDKLKNKIAKKFKIVFTVHGLSVLDPNYQANRLFKYIYFKLFKLAFKKIDNIVFVSKNNFDFAKDSGLLADFLDRSSLIYNALDLKDDYFLSSEESRKFLLENHSKKLDANFFSNFFVCVSIGRLAYPKNYEFLISSFKDLKKEINNLKLVIIGDGPKYDEYDRLIKTYRLEADIILLGGIDNAASYLKAFDLFILPSIFEGLSISLIEARLASVPVIASSVGGNHEVISSVNCFKLNDANDFIAKVKAVYNGDYNRLDKGEELFSIAAMVNKYREIYRDRN